MKCALALAVLLSQGLSAAIADTSTSQIPPDRVLAALQDVSVEPERRMRGQGAKWDHRIQVALPASYGKSASAFPVLWVTDGPAYFEMAVIAVNHHLMAHIPEMIVVAVGVPCDALDQFGHRRSYEFSTKSPGFSGFGGALMGEHLNVFAEQLKAAGQPELEAGGAPQFLRFLVEEVRPALAKDYRMVADQHVLFGDSGGGLFCTFALLSRPDSFAKYICGSPNLYSGDYDLFRMEERYAREHKDLKADVFFGAGEGEILEPGAIPAFGIVSSMTRMAEILSLRKYPSLKLHARIFPGEDHMSVIPVNLSWGLRTLLKKQ